ncbi:hypothetical protein PVAND_005283 [Polypedilum vanderplanki]|uniref:Uncharacterized protein n=1 Tax=Polypedilum vanderplanki TaxID=319348 RepID=A0A9J6C1L6_POLVA|nr:hypothetical protein PVAND_005283 [Polypedilum vanderplanki]
MEQKNCAKKFILVIILLMLLDAVKCEEDDSEELKRKIDPVFIMPNDEIFIRSVNDNCFVTCNGSDIHWEYPNGTTVDSKKGRIYVEDFSTLGSQAQSLRLIFDTIDENDNGKWTCVGNIDRKSFTMSVYVPIEFEPLQQEISVKEHENVTLNCVAYGNPQPTIHWSFKSISILELEKKLTSHFIKKKDSLFIKNIGRHHSGEYTCKAVQMTFKSITDMKELAIQLNVEYPPEILYSNRSKVNGKLENLVYTKYAVANSTVKLICEADSNPLPTFLWYHNGKKMSHHHINNTDFFSELTVNFHSNNTFGDYKCIARNILNQTSMQIKIIEGKRPEPPHTISLIGSGDKILDIYVGSNMLDPNDPLAITHYRFELVCKDDFVKNNFEWKDPFYEEKEAKINVSYTLINLKPNTTYIVRIAARNVIGLSDWAPMKEFSTLANEPIRNGCISNFSNIYIYLIVVAVALATKNQTGESNE